MSLFDLLIGRPIATTEERAEHIGPIAGIPVFGLDALSSAAYGPEAALTLLIPLGVAGIQHIVPISFAIIGLLVIVFVSYLQTIDVYPHGGGSYTVASENLGAKAGLLAAAALMIDYILNAAVGISAGVGALVSAFPVLQPHMLALCLFILIILTLINVRGVKDTGSAFLIPTYLFVGTLLLVIIVGAVRSLAAGGHPMPVVARPRLPVSGSMLTLWVLAKVFASGCTAMTGVEAVSNGVNAFREPTQKNAKRTLTIIIVLLMIFLAGIALLCRAYGIGATDPGAVGYQSILSQLTAAVMGHGWFYYITIGSILAVLAAVGEHVVCGLSASHARHRDARLSATRVQGSRAPAALLSWRGCVGRLHRAAADCIRRCNGSVDPAVCHRSFSCLHALAGRDGDALEATGRQRLAPTHDHQRRWSPCYWGHATDRTGCEVYGRRVDHGSSYSRVDRFDERSQTPLRPREPRDRN